MVKDGLEERGQESTREDRRGASLERMGDGWEERLRMSWEAETRKPRNSDL